MLVRWLAGGRGHALRHLGWTRLIAALTRHLCTDMARARVLAELEAIEGVLDGSLGGLAHAEIVDRRGPAVAAAIGRLPSYCPQTEREAAQARLDELLGIEALTIIDSREGPSVAAALRELEDLDESLAVARSGGFVSVVELVGVAELCRACAELGTTLATAERAAADGRLDAEASRGVRACVARLAEIGGRTDEGEREGHAIARCPELLAELDRAIDRPAGEEPRIASDASPALAEARNRVRAAKRELHAMVERLLRKPSIADALRDRYWTERDGRIVLPVRSDRLGAVRSRGAIIHDSSASGQTFYVEPASLVEGNNALREAELAVADEERKILRLLSSAVAERAATLASMQRVCVELDLMLARLRFGESLPVEVRVPQLSGSSDDEREGPAIELRAARHPAMLLDGVEVVPNDIVLECGHALIVSGPNAGGKTVALETLGILALLAAAGFALPCEGRARLPVFARLITDIGDDQSIAANLSTFSAHVAHVLEALAASDGAGEVLVLLDEVAVGTDPEQGAALAESILVELVERGATVVATTHYDRLKLLATVEGPLARRFHNAAVGFDLARMRPTFRLSLGVPGSSSALAVARRLGMPDAVLERAEALLGDEGVRVDELLRDIEAERAALARTRERLEREQLRLSQRDRDVRARERRVLEGVRSRRAKAYAAAAEQLRALEAELERKRKSVRRLDPQRVDELPTKAELAGEARAALAEHRAQTEAERAAARDPDDRLDPRTLELGARVRVVSINQDGQIVALSGRPPKQATVQLANARMSVKVRDLGRPRATPEAKKTRRKRAKAAPILDFRAAVREQAQAHFGEGAVALKAGVDNSCDVRGLRFEDAQDRVASFVAEALGRDQDVILIRHGHGGGALRKAVREVLSRLANVRRQRPGLDVEGGDAVTVAWID